MAKVIITRDDAIKGKAYKAGQSVEFSDSLCSALLAQKRATIPDEEKQSTTPEKKAK